MWKPHAPPPARITKSPDPESKKTARRIAQIVKLKPEFIEKYKEVHAAVWPEVLEQIKACNIEDYSIFHDPGTGILFASFKYVGNDYAGDMARMRENPKVREWWAMTDGFQESFVPGAHSSESGPPWWREVEEVFYLE
ncbi:rhamnose mutarotase [Daldinia vernicosa]|uniref:rhamnose mutarotase n=1 Tax=Daldinia vernicosa TaxID=114800 RepID=UPI0020081B53|nr:rhamnose mutarotase [Daldinia vernicosa]KAI0848232.1 rhamnose mutarotase [Daldinia vernicosa]